MAGLTDTIALSGKPAIFLDFDGTITTRDATDVILEAHADPAWLRIEEAWKAGRLGSRECLTAQMALVAATRQEVDALLDGIDVDQGFLPLLDVCAAGALPVHIVSDGFDHCIDRILTRPSLGLASHLRHIPIVSSHLELRGLRWHVSFTSFDQACVHGCATCKPLAIARLNPAGGPVIFVGDGLSDRYAAACADVVFARDGLAAYCDEGGIPYTRYDNLATVAGRIEELLGQTAATHGGAFGKVHSSS